MTNLRSKEIALTAVLAAGILLSTACSKKVARVTPPSPPPPPAAPTATLAASPNVVQRGQTTVLSWQTTNATEISIPGLGVVPASGSRSITPEISTTYTLTAKGPGGTRDASTRVTVKMQAAATAPSPSDEDLFSKNVRDVFFDYDKSDIRTDEAPVAQNDASFLVQHPNIKVLLEGHCDDRGSEEYNLALGTSRAESLKQSLLQQGISPARIRTISYGKEKPFCSQNNEQCWQRNRVDHIAYDR